MNRKYNSFQKVNNMEIERNECPRAVWYISKLEDANDLFINAAAETRKEQFVGFELKLDDSDWSVASKRFGTLQEAAQEAGSILNYSEKNTESTLLSLRMFFSLSKPRCRTNALNVARHECKVCSHDFKDRCAEPCSYIDPNNLQFSCYTNAEIAHNARQTQDHFSRLAQYHQGDGTFFPVTAIQKIPDPAGQSLLKQALRVAKGLSPTEIPKEELMKSRFTVFNEQHYALIPPNARADRQPEPYRWPWGRQNNRLNLRQRNARPFDCVEDEIDIEARQEGSFFDVHFSGNPTREEYFLDIAAQKGINKFQVVAALEK